MAKQKYKKYKKKGRAVSRKRSKKGFANIFANNRMPLLIVGFILVMFLGASTAFTGYYFGPSSAWEADVEIHGVSDGIDWLTTADEIKDLGGFPSARLVKIDFDGDPIEQHSGTISYINTIGGSSVSENFPVDAPGMEPTVDISVGQLFLSDREGNIVTSYVEWEDVDDETGLLRFYFTFSVAFTTRAKIMTVPYTSYVLGLSNYNDKILWVDSDGLPEMGGIDVNTIVQLRIGNDALDYDYKGQVEDVILLNTRARYTYLASDMGVSDVSLDIFNSEYDWKTIRESGIAVAKNPTQPIQLIKNVIDTENENMAELTCGAMLKAGLDANEVYTAIPLTITPIDDLSVYNVEFIYDLVCEVTLNGIPLTAKGALLSGRIDYVFIPPKDPDPFDWMEYWWVIVIVAVLLVGGGAKKRSDGVVINWSRGGSGEEGVNWT